MNGWVAWGTFHLSVAQFPHYEEGNSSTYPTELLWGVE